MQLYFIQNFNIFLLFFKSENIYFCVNYATRFSQNDIKNAANEYLRLIGLFFALFLM